MSNNSSGKIVETNARRLLDDLILLAEAKEIPEWRQRSRKPLTAKLTQDSLILTFTISALVELTENNKYDRKLTTDQINSSINFLENFLGILERPKNQQGQTQEGTIKLWDKDRKKNLKQFDRECDNKRREKNQEKSDPWQYIRNKIPSEFDLLDREFFQRREGDDVRILNLPSAAKNWSLITKGYYIDRDQQEEALEIAKNLSFSKGISFLLIRGIPGEGKTALMKWLVYQLSNNGYIVLQRKREKQDWLESLESFSQQRQRQHFYFFADDLFRDDFLVKELLANELQFPLTIIVTTRLNEDRQEELTKFGYSVENLDLQLSSNDKERILAKIQQQDSEAKARLAQKTRQEINKLMDSPSMLVLMLQLSEGKPFDSIIADVIKRLPSEQNYPVYQVFGVICCFYQYGIAVYPDILPLCLPEYTEDSIKYVVEIAINFELKGLVNIVLRSGFEGLATVHELIAETAIQNTKYRRDRGEQAENLPYSANFLEKYLKIAIPQLKNNQEIHRRFLMNLLRIVANNDQVELVLQLLQEYSEQIISLQQNSSITGWSYWSTMYAAVGLKQEQKRCLQAILSTEPQDSSEYLCRLSLIIQNSTQEQIKELILSTTDWLSSHLDDINVRQKYLDLVQQSGTKQEKENAIASTSEWLKKHPDDIHVRQKYLDLVQQSGTNQEKENLIISTTNWLEFHPDDIHVRQKYLDLVQQSGTNQEKENLIISTTNWLEFHPDDIHVRQKYLDLVQQCGTDKQKENLIISTTDWLYSHLDDINVRSKYLALVGREFKIVEDIQLIIDRQWQWISKQSKVEQNLWTAFLPVLSHHNKNNTQLIRQASQLALEQYPKDFVIACAVFYFQDYLEFDTSNELADFIADSNLPKYKWYHQIYVANFFRDYGELDKAETIYKRTINNSRYCIDNFGNELENTFDFARVNYARLLILRNPPLWKIAMNEYLEPLLKTNSNHSLAHLYMAQCHLQKISSNRNKNISNHIYNPVIYHFKQAIKYQQETTGKYEYEFGYFYWKTKKDIHQARQHFINSLREKNNLPACVALAELELEAGNKNKAQEYIEQGLAIETITRSETEEKEKLMPKIKKIRQQLNIE
ncbi:MAG: hypothetical protein ACRC2S_09760 [Waterburya sp.]